MPFSSHGLKLFGEDESSLASIPSGKDPENFRHALILALLSDQITPQQHFSSVSHNEQFPFRTFSNLVYLGTPVWLLVVVENYRSQNYWGKKHLLSSYFVRNTTKEQLVCQLIVQLNK